MSDQPPTASRPHGRSILLLACVAILAAGLLAAAWRLAAGIEAQAVQAGLQQARLLARFLDRDWTALLARTERLNELAGRITLAMQAGDTVLAEALRAELARQIAPVGDSIIQVGATDTQGQLLWTTLGMPPRPVPHADREHISAILARGAESFIGQPVEGRVSGLRTIQLSHAVRDANGRLAGVAVVSQAVSAIDAFTRQLELDPADSLMVAREDGLVLTRTGGSEHLPSAATLRVQLRALGGGEATGRDEGGVDGRLRLLAARRLAMAPVVVTAAVDAGKWLQPAAQEASWLRHGAAALAAGMLATAGLAVVLQERRRRRQSDQDLLNGMRCGEALLRQLAGQLSMLVCLHDADGRYLTVGDAAPALLGITPEDLVGSMPGSLTLPQDHVILAQAWHRLQYDGTPQCLEIRIRRPDGGIRWVENEILRLAAPGMEIPGMPVFLSVTRDVTARRSAEAASRAAQRELQAVVSTMPGFLARSRVLHGGLRQVGFVSPSVEMMLGYTPEQAKAPGFWDGKLDPEVAARRRARIAAARDGEKLDLTFPMRRADGARVWLHETATVRLRPEGWREIVGFFVDVTDRQEAEAALTRARADLDDIVRNGPGVLFRRVRDEHGRWRMTYVSANVQRVTGYTVAEIMRPGFLETVADLDDPGEDGTRQQSGEPSRGQETSTWECRFRDPSGGTRWLRCTTRLKRLEDGQAEIVGVMLDITAEREAAEALAGARRELDTIAGLGPAVLLRAMYDRAGEHIVYISGNAGQALGYTAAELMQPGFAFGLLHPDDLKPVGEFLALLRTRGLLTSEKRYRSRDGSWRWMRRTIRVVADDGTRIEALGILMDITREREAEAARDQARAELAAIVAAGPGALYRIRIDADHRRQVNYMSEAFERITGHPVEVMTANKMPEHLFDPATFPPGPVRTADLLQRGNFTREYRFRHADGHWIWLRDNVALVASHPDGTHDTIGYLTDITRERETAERVAQAGRMALLGELANGIAHELERPLATARTAAELTLAGLATPQPHIPTARHGLEQVVELTRRATAVVAHMRAFGCEDSGPVMPVEIADAIAASLLILRGRLRLSGVAVQRDIPPDLPPVLARLMPLEQVLVNLIANACDAYENVAAIDRVVRISAREVGGHVVLRVADDAGGVSDTVIGRVFEPFFTTRDGATATGLGLSISQDIVADFGGRLSVCNATDGAVFEIELPTAALPMEAAGLGASGMAAD
ncbi:Histidine kinase [Rhodovastum atsumiense]|uniref:histidine kinase n=1 Tax=Rhodovastum atsumiense TaxID=504468 RepID=A0A5M6ILT2_9PROT|nr:PAS domain S-box protein [Rhodovastum atsumiense]KAA5609243.1 PAS domain-containing protein [Rhodovastum atsumiense]CAH2601694.1 Histidine kinase [Rhodovastum atsumiense]